MTAALWTWRTAPQFVPLARQFAICMVFTGISIALRPVQLGHDFFAIAGDEVRGRAAGSAVGPREHVDIHQSVKYEAAPDSGRGFCQAASPKPGGASSMRKLRNSVWVL